MTSERKLAGGWVSGRLDACRWCQGPIPRRRRTFCSDACVHEWKLRSNPGYLREKVFERDRGVCAGCGIDTVKLERELRTLRRRNPAAHKSRCQELGIPLNRRKNLWDADHIIPVAEGGGACGLDNIRTVCLSCHRAITQLLRERLKRTATGATS